MFSALYSAVIKGFIFLIVQVVLLAIPGETVHEMPQLLHDVIHKVVTSKMQTKAKRVEICTMTFGRNL